MVKKDDEVSIFEEYKKKKDKLECTCKETLGESQCYSCEISKLDPLNEVE